jgi:hypothetical protein
LRETGSVQLDGAGAGVTKVGPVSAREVWHPLIASVLVSSAAADASCTIYVGSAIYPGAARDSTFTGSSGDTTQAISADTLRCGEWIFAVWAAGDPRAVATLTVTGTKDV